MPTSCPWRPRPHPHRLPRAGLCAGHEVASGSDDGDGILLDGRGPQVLALGDALLGRVEELALVKAVDVGGGLPARHLHRDLVILVKVDASRHRLKDGVLVLGWGRRNVHLPLHWERRSGVNGVRGQQTY